MNTGVSKSGILDTARHNFAESAERLQISKSIRERLEYPQERIEWTGNPMLSDGSVRRFKAFVVRHSDALGPSKGGIRMTSSVTMDDVTGLAMEMTWKTSLVGVPFGGGKSGIQCDPFSLNSRDKEAVIRSFTRGIRRHIGPEIYVPAPDMGTNETDMGHIRDCISYSDGTSITKGCFVTGKPLILGGIVGRREATGKGAVFAILAACERLGIDIRSAGVVVQGFGNVGSIAAREIARSGARVIAVGDLSGAVINSGGLDIAALTAHAARSGGVKGFPGAVAARGSDILQLDCDILVPAAAESQITASNAAGIRARIVAEGANAPTTPEADRILNERKALVIPDILCNAGGVFVSYLEYAQETKREQMTLAEVETRLSDRMTGLFRKVYEYSNEEGLSMRQAAMDIAVTRVAEAVVARGILP